MKRALYPILSGIMALGLTGVAPSAHATILTYTFSPGSNFSSEIGDLSGSVVVTLNDGGGSGSVSVTIDTNGLDGSLSEKVTGLYLNLDPSIDPTSLASGVSFPGDNINPEVTSVSFGTNAFQADGDGLYDIVINWTTSAGPDLFEADETDIITFTLAGLEAEDFDFLSKPAGGHGPFHAVLRAQSLGSSGTQSGWFDPTRGFDPGDETVLPEPGSLALFGFGLAGLALAIRRRRARRL